jgi:hypothetical protein
MVFANGFGLANSHFLSVGMVFVALYIRVPNEVSFVEKFGAIVFYEIIECKTIRRWCVVFFGMGLRCQFANALGGLGATHGQRLARLYGVG